MKTLELMALGWLRFEKRCQVAIVERTPRWGHGQPDVLGITHDRYLLEIEVKRSMSDFRANAEKPHIAARLSATQSATRWPRLFWYMVPASIAAKVEAELPPWAGLLVGPDNQDQYQAVISKVKAPANKAASRLTTRECVELTHCMANMIYSLAQQVHRMQAGKPEPVAMTREELERKLRQL